MDQLIASTFEGFAEWPWQAAGQALSRERAATAASLALGSLMSSRLLKNVIGAQALSPPDDELVSARVDMVIALIEVQPAPEN